MRSMPWSTWPAKRATNRCPPTWPPESGALLKAALRAAHGRKVVQEQVSGYYLALEIRQTYVGMMVAIPAAHWAVFHRLDDAGMAAVLREMAERVRLARYRKSVRGPKKKPP